MIRRSNVSEDVRSIQEPNMFDANEIFKEEPFQFIPKSGNKNRMSVDFKKNEEFEGNLGGLQLEKLRFPSFDSGVGFHFQNMVNNEDEPLFWLENSSIFNEMKFDLESDAKRTLSNSKLFSEAERKLFWNLINSKSKNLLGSDRQQSIQKYKIKKQRRKMVYKIRYKVRQDLAIKRLRNKGKFIKSKKLDIRTAANLIMIGLINRKRKEGTQRIKSVWSSNEVGIV